MKINDRFIKIIRIIMFLFISMSSLFLTELKNETYALNENIFIYGEEWLQGQGVNVYSNGNNYDTFYQCPEVAKRLYDKMGWPVVKCGINGGAAYIPEGSPELVCYKPGSGYVPVPGDLIIENPTKTNPYGHIAVVDYTQGNIIYAVEQNAPAKGKGRKEYIYNNSYYDGGYGTIKAIMHAPQNNFNNFDSYSNTLNTGAVNNIIATYKTDNGLNQTYLQFNEDKKISEKYQITSNVPASSNVKFADVNGDKLDDYIVSYINDNNTLELQTMLTNGDGTFKEIQTTIDNVIIDSNKKETEEFTDISGDGKLDYIMIYSDSNGRLTILSLLSNGDGTFKAGYNTTKDGYDFIRNEINQGIGKFVDINGDNKTDYAITLKNNDNSFNLISFISNGDGSFTDGYNTTQNGYSLSVDLDNQYRGQFVDVNGDRRTDYVMPFNDNKNHSNLVTFLSNGDGTFSQGCQTIVDGYSFIDNETDNFVDINNDNKVDYVISLVTENGELELLKFLSNGDGTFNKEDKPIEKTSSFNEKLNLSNLDVFNNNKTTKPVSLMKNSQDKLLVNKDKVIEDKLKRFIDINNDGNLDYIIITSDVNGLKISTFISDQLGNFDEKYDTIINNVNSQNLEVFISSNNK